MLPDWDYLEHLARGRKLPRQILTVFSILVGLGMILGALWLA